MPNTFLSGFNHYPMQRCAVLRPERYQQLQTLLKQPVIARGRGCSYGDAALNQQGQVILTERLNHFLAFDRERGVLTVEAGITLAEILTVIIPCGWFLPVTPGTQHASLGGCVASDVHGKNHLQRGSIGQHILALELIQCADKVTFCSTNENPDLFWATVGGMGLTGIIGTVSLQLIPIPSSYMAVSYQPTSDLEHTFTMLNHYSAHDPYRIAWLDLLCTAKTLGRGIIMTAHHAEVNELSTSLRTHPLSRFSKRRFSIPAHCPPWLLNKALLKFYNHHYWHKQQRKNFSNSPHILSYQDYFYPLDHIQHWNRLYGKRGFIQYQCVLPHANALENTQKMLQLLHNNHYPVFLATLKCFGASEQGMLSFPLPGFTLALDLPLLDQQLFSVLAQLDEIVANAGGRIYLAKDTHLSESLFRDMYPRYTEWLRLKNEFDPNHIFRSSLSQRLAITPATH